MERFENAQIGDLVYCRQNGCGKVHNINPDYSHPISVVFENNFWSYKKTGHKSEEHAEPMLFFRKGEERYLTERPETEIDWANVKRGTGFLVWNDTNDIYKSNRKFHMFDGTAPWFNAGKCHLCTWDFAEPVNPSEVPYK